MVRSGWVVFWETGNLIGDLKLGNIYKTVGVVRLKWRL